MLALLSAPLALLAALVVRVIVVAVRGDLAFLREVEHEAHHWNVEVVELNGDFLQIALHSYVTARYNAAFGGARGYGLRGALHHGKLHRRLFVGSVQRLFRHITQGFRHAVNNVGILLCGGVPSSLIAFAML